MIGERRAGHVGQVVLLPDLTAQRRFGGRLIEGMVEPAMPVRRHPRGFGDTVINDPAARAAHRARRIGFLVITVALLVLADKPCAAPEQRKGGSHRRAVPPGEDTLKHFYSFDRRFYRQARYHARSAGIWRRPAFASIARICRAFPRFGWRFRGFPAPFGAAGHGPQTLRMSAMEIILAQGDSRRSPSENQPTFHDVFEGF